MATSSTIGGDADDKHGDDVFDHIGHNYDLLRGGGYEDKVSSGNIQQVRSQFTRPSTAAAVIHPREVINLVRRVRIMTPCVCVCVKITYVCSINLCMI